MNPIKKLFRFLYGSCPYTIAGRKCVETMSGKKHKPALCLDKAKTLRQNIRLGRNMALIGFFCPIFWMSLFSGADASTLRFNAVHSGLIIILGIVVMVINYVYLRHLEKE